MHSFLLRFFLPFNGLSLDFVEEIETESEESVGDSTVELYFTSVSDPESEAFWRSGTSNRTSFIRSSRTFASSSPVAVSLSSSIERENCVIY